MRCDVMRCNVMLCDDICIYMYIYIYICTHQKQSFTQRPVDTHTGKQSSSSGRVGSRVGQLQTVATGGARSSASHAPKRPRRCRTTRAPRCICTATCASHGRSLIPQVCLPLTSSLVSICHCREWWCRGGVGGVCARTCST